MGRFYRILLVFFSCLTLYAEDMPKFIPLADAIELDRLDLLKHPKAPYTFNIKQKVYGSPIIFRAQSLEILQFLESKGYSLFETDKFNSNLLFHFINYYDMKMLTSKQNPISRYLLSKGLDIDHINDFGESPMSRLIPLEEFNVFPNEDIQYYVSKGASFKNVQITQDFMKTESFQHYIKGNYPYKISSNETSYYLVKAFHNSDTKTLRKLLQAGAKWECSKFCVSIG